MKKNKYSDLLWFLTISCLVILSYSKSNKDSFANNLANDIILTFNKGAGEKEPLITDVLKFSNQEKGMNVIMGGVNPTEIPFLKEGLSDGFGSAGLVEFVNYQSVYGRFSNQQLQCNRVFHVVPNTTNVIDYIIIQVWGVLTNGSEDSIKINYAFKFDNADGPFNPDTVQLLAGQIQEDRDMYDVVLRTHSEASNSEQSIPNPTSKSWLARLWESITGRGSTSKIVDVSSSSSTTSIQVKAGDRLKLQASGEISLGFFAGSGGPDGIEGYEIYRKVSALRHGALIGRVGDGDWFLVGSGKELVTQTDGILYLEVNDSDPSNNQGKFTVQCQIE